MSDGKSDMDIRYGHSDTSDTSDTRNASDNDDDLLLDVDFA